MTCRSHLSQKYDRQEKLRSGPLPMNFFKMESPNYIIASFYKATFYPIDCMNFLIMDNL